MAGLGPGELSERIRELAVRLGFSGVGFSRAGALPGDRLLRWLDAGYHGEMYYLARLPERRLDPREVWDSARTVVSLAWGYSPRRPATGPGEGVVSRYAQGSDYHLVVREKLESLLAEIRLLEPAAEGRCLVDSAPILEKEWAARAGLGWIGKHTNLISQKRGSWFFLAELLLSLELPEDLPVTPRCGTCTRCIDACPTNAIVAPYQLDARRCIAYLTIELKGSIPAPLRTAMGGLIFGCDICQEVCPWNLKAARDNSDGSGSGGLPEANWDLVGLSRLTQEEFSERFAGSPIQRPKWGGFLRNVAVAMGNLGQPKFVDELERLSGSASTMVAEHAAWAASQFVQDPAASRGSSPSSEV